MKFKNNKHNKYGAYSLVEMLITMALISFLLTGVSLILNTMIRVSTMTDARTLARSETEFVTEVLDLAISNSGASNVSVFDSTGRGLTSDGQIVIVGSEAFEYVAPDSGIVGNEIHLISTKADRWTCIGYFVGVVDGEEHGFILKTSASTELIPPGSTSALEHSRCFEPSNPDLYEYLTYFNSFDISIESSPDNAPFTVQYYNGGDQNLYVVMGITARPENWVAGEQAYLSPYYHRELVSRTRKLKF